jgi:TRAP transporter TAXI family solute receptor
MHRRHALITLLLAATLAACGGPTAPGEAGGGDGSASGRRFLSVGTAPPGGAFFVVGGALGEVLDAHGPDGWSVTAEATKGSQENIRRLARGELDLALSNAAITYFAVRGSEGWEQAYDVRTVMTLAPNVALFLTPAGSGVASLADLAGQRVVVGPAGAGFEYFLRPLLAAHGVTYDDFTPLNNTQAGAVDMLSDGSAVAAFLGGAVPTASITQAASSMDIRFIPFDPEAVTALTGEYQFFDTARIPAGTYRGQDDDFAGLNVGSMHLITGAGADEELIYSVTRTIWENRERVVEKHPAGRAIQAGVVVRDTGTPFHPGAERFYREIGIWPDGDPAP